MNDQEEIQGLSATGRITRWEDMPRPIVCLAPMDGITDSAYRRIVRGFSQDVVLFSEFTNADGFLRSDRVRSRLDYRPEEHPYFVQLFGNKPQSFAEASRALADLGVAGIDINMGCPAKKIVASQHGSGLMQDVKQACRIVEAVANAVSIQVSVKTRLGWKDDSGLVHFTKRLVDAGASMITIHGRTYDQNFSGQANWTPIYDLKEHLSVPLLGNGDVTDVIDGHQRLGPLDGFMIGRGAIGNPWAFLPHPWQHKPSLLERVEVIKRHYGFMLESKSPRRALLEFRKHLSGYLRDIPYVKPFRAKLMTAPDEDTLFALLDDLAQRLPGEAEAC